MFEFKATLDKVTMDRDGECKIILVVPLSDRSSVLKLAEKTEAVLNVSIETKI